LYQGGGRRNTDVFQGTTTKRKGKKSWQRRSSDTPLMLSRYYHWNYIKYTGKRKEDMQNKIAAFCTAILHTMYNPSG
ncbi:MAG: hypothetical protein Q4C93_05430, partial [Clostridia bacterium]|nr:hypothetical protein [Clostridia bacterium]